MYKPDNPLENLLRFAYAVGRTIEVTPFPRREYFEQETLDAILNSPPDN